MNLDKDFRALMPKLTASEYSKLEQSIINEGCRDALIVWNDILIDGYNRYEICQKHSIDFKTISILFADRNVVTNWIIDNQLGRRNLTVEQKNYLIGKKYKEAKKEHGGDRKSSYQNDNLKTHQKIAEEYKISEQTVIRAEKFADAVDVIAENVGSDVRDEILSRELDVTAKDVQILAKQEPEIQKEVVEKVRSGKSMKKAIQESKNELVETPPLPEGKYNVIYADPPWEYNNTIRSWGPASLHYPTLPLEKICDYRDKNNSIIEKFADDAVLFLWVTNPFLQDAFKVVESWGFNYKTAMVWVKRNLQRPGSGFYVRGHHELLFICTKGSFVPDQTGKEPIGSVIDADIGEHSAKPEIVYEIIEKMYPDGKYLELFLRGKPRERWTGHGYEATT